MVIEDYFATDELEPIKKEVEDLVDYLADGLYDAGKLKGNRNPQVIHTKNS